MILSSTWCSNENLEMRLWNKGYETQSLIQASKLDLKSNRRSKNNLRFLISIKFWSEDSYWFKELLTTQRCTNVCVYTHTHTCVCIYSVIIQSLLTFLRLSFKIRNYLKLRNTESRKIEELPNWLSTTKRTNILTLYT